MQSAESTDIVLLHNTEGTIYTIVYVNDNLNECALWQLVAPEPAFSETVRATGSDASLKSSKIYEFFSLETSLYV